TERRDALRGHRSRGPYHDARSPGRPARRRRRRTRHLTARGEPHRRRHADLPWGRLVRPFCPGERAGDHVALAVLYLVYSVPAGTEPGTPPGPVGIPEPDLRTHGDGRSEHLDVRCLDGPRRGRADGPPPTWRQDGPDSK